MRNSFLYIGRNSLLALFLFVFVVGCQKNYTPKPRAYFRIDTPESNYTPYSNNRFSISISDKASLQVKRLTDQEIWFDIVYPQYKSTIFCTYFAVTNDSIQPLLDDNKQLLYSHTKKASQFQEMTYSDGENQKFGSLYKIEGRVATPFQFYITDTKHHFLRGSLYFEYEVERDSILPVLEVLEQDLTELFNSLSWK